MPRAALRDNLIDDLVDVIDEVREDVNVDLGIRPWRVFLIRRLWSGTEPGDGDITIVSKVEIRPQPSVFVPGLAMSLVPTGLVEAGEIELREVSLRLREDEVAPRDLARNEEFFYRLVASLGQKQLTRHYVLSKPPEVDREGDIGWRITLQRAQIKEAVDFEGGLAGGLGTSVGGI